MCVKTEQSNVHVLIFTVFKRYAELNENPANFDRADTATSQKYELHLCIFYFRNPITFVIKVSVVNWLLIHERYFFYLVII